MTNGKLVGIGRWLGRYFGLIEEPPGRDPEPVRSRQDVAVSYIVNAASLIGAIALAPVLDVSPFLLVALFVGARLGVEVVLSRSGRDADRP
jgi:hypothetical protein